MDPRSSYMYSTSMTSAKNETKENENESKGVQFHTDEMLLIKLMGTANRQSSVIARKFVPLYHRNTRLGCVLTNATSTKMKKKNWNYKLAIKTHNCYEALMWRNGPFVRLVLLTLTVSGFWRLYFGGLSRQISFWIFLELQWTLLACKSYVSCACCFNILMLKQHV